MNLEQAQRGVWSVIYASYAILRSSAEEVAEVEEEMTKFSTSFLAFYNEAEDVKLGVASFPHL